MNSVTDLFQLALDQVGTRSEISSVDEASREAEVCRRLYPMVRDWVFRASFWPSTKKTARLALLAERDDSLEWMPGDPDPHWHYAYSRPVDLMSARYLSTFGRFDIAAQGDGHIAIHTNEPQAILFYTYRNENPAAWDPGLQMAVMTGLAAFACMPLAAKPSRARALQEQANDIIMAARVATANELQESYDSIPEWLVARGAANLGPSPRYLYPYSPLLSVTREVSAAGVVSV